jgi:hypothetical protein
LLLSASVIGDDNPPITDNLKISEKGVDRGCFLDFIYKRHLEASFAAHVPSTLVRSFFGKDLHFTMMAKGIFNEDSPALVEGWSMVTNLKSSTSHL